MEITYEEFINHILETRGRFACGEEYHERHHIMPKCMDGTNDKDNLIDLFAREHFEAHRLLALENPENDGLVYAWWCMCSLPGSSKKREDVTAEEYEEARKEFAKIQSLKISRENNPMYGRHHSEEARKKISEANKGENHPNYGRHLPEETCKRISKHHARMSGKSHPNYGRRFGEEVRKKMSDEKKGKYLGEMNPMYGKRHNEEIRKKMSENHADFSGKKHPRARKVIQYDLDGKLIKFWDYITQAANELNIPRTTINNCCTGNLKTAGGYHWYYLYDQTRKDGTVIQGAISLGLITEEEALQLLEKQKE